MTALKKILRAVAAGTLATSALAQQPGIQSIDNGRLTFTNITSNIEYRIQWSGTSPANATNDLFNRVEYVAPTGAAMTLEVPIFFNVAATNALSNGIFRASEQPFNVPMGTNSKADVEWSELAGGPWSTNWGVVIEQTSTGAVVSVPTPRFFRVSFVNCPSNYHSCASWTDRTDPAASRAITFGLGSYTSACMKIKMGQSVSFTGDFSNYPLRTGCQDCGAMTNSSAFGFGILTFTFEHPGYFGYYGENFGFPDTGAGMGGNIWVIP